MRGVNKLVVEIKDTDSRYFDRCLLFLKPQSEPVPQSELSENAEKLLNSVMNGKKGHRMPVGAAILMTVLGAVIGAAAGFLL